MCAGCRRALSGLRLGLDEDLGLGLLGGLVLHRDGARDDLDILVGLERDVGRKHGR